MKSITAPVVIVDGYSATFYRMKVPKRGTRYVHFGWVLGRTFEGEPYPALRGGWFMWEWEPAHEFYLGITQEDWEHTLPRTEQMRAELWLQARIWLPDQYPTSMAQQNYPGDFETWAKTVHFRKRRDEDYDTFLDRPYGPSPLEREAGAYWRRFLRNAGWPIPPYRQYDIMPLSLGESRRLAFSH